MEHWEVILPMIVFDYERCSNEEGQICYRSVNSITDNVMTLIHHAVIANNREVLINELRKIHVLRVIDSEVQFFRTTCPACPKVENQIVMSNGYSFCN